jgi:uncharacterized protein (TIGR02996 family)
MGVVVSGFSMSMRTDLELAILADPDARASYAVYADWLLEHGDPDGELIAVQLALEDAPGDARLLARERKLLAAKEDQLRRLFYVGATRAIRHPIWRRGVLHALEIRGAEDNVVTANAYGNLLPRRNVPGSIATASMAGGVSDGPTPPA